MAPMSQRLRRLVLRDGGGRAGTGSGTPSITLAFAPAWRLAISSSIASIARSICSSVIALTPPEWSNFISRGTSKAHIFMYTAGCCLRTFSIAAAPCFLKSAASASRKSLLNDLRVAYTLYGARVYVELGRRLAHAHAARQCCSDSLSQLVRDRHIALPAGVVVSRPC